jgi:hypothetical protein
MALTSCRALTGGAPWRADIATYSRTLRRIKAAQTD